MPSMMGYIIRRTIKPHIGAYAACLKDRLLPTLGNIEQEARRVEREYYERLCSSRSSEDADLASYAEQAQDEGIDHYTMMMSITHGLVSLFTAGLFHLFEQKLMSVYGQSLQLDDLPVSFNFSDLKDAFGKTGIQLDTFRSYPKLQELHHAANCIKHGDGRSCDELRRRRPELFRPPDFDTLEASREFLRQNPVRQPLGGEDLFISHEEFETYVEAVQGFWDDLADTLENR